MYVLSLRLSVNPAFETLTGYNNSEALGQNIQFLVYGEENSDFFENIINNIRKDGLWKGRIKNKREDGVTFHSDATISPVKDETGEISHYVSVQRDVTNEIQMEIRLRQAQKMEAIGTLAGGIAHDFNNILSAIIGYNDLAMCDAIGNPEILSKLGKVSEAGQRASDLVGHILSFSRRTEESRHPLPIQPVIREALKLLHGSLPATIEIRCNINKDCGVVLADTTQVHQVLMNLCTNAFHAMRQEGGVLDVSMSEVNIENEKLGSTLNLKDKTYIKLTVKDSGHGMSKEVMERIFDPYFTTKEMGEGTGLGLSTVHGIIQSHDGAITLNSEVGKGSAFHVYLPVYVEEVAVKNNMDIDDIQPQGSERILLIDDEEAIVNLEKISLSRLGYSVHEFTSSIEALNVFDHNPEKFDVVVSDLTMPKMTGDLLAKKVQAIKPNTPFILCTGSIEAFTKCYHGEESGIHHIVKKPATNNAIAKAIRQVVDRIETNHS